MVELTCPLCLEVLSTTTNYRTGCCGAYLCWDCFEHLNSNQSATCEQCHNTVEPFQVDTALAQLIHKAVFEAISDLTTQLESTQHDLRLVQANLTALQANLTSLYQEIDDSDDLNDLNDRHRQLTSLAHSQTKAYQLILDRLTTREQLLLSRLDYLTHITAKSAEILTLLTQWRQFSGGNATTDPVIETYQPRVWWRCRQGCPKSFQTTWLVVPLAVNSAGQVIPRINHLVSKTRQSLTRLLVPPDQPPGKSQASVIMIRQQDIMLAQGRALILSSGDNPVWRINDDPAAPLDLNLSLGLVPSGQAIRGCSIGLLPQGYYISYQRELVKSGWFGQTSTEVVMTLLNYDRGVNPDQSAIQASRTWTITLPAWPANNISMMTSGYLWL